MLEPRELSPAQGFMCGGVPRPPQHAQVVLGDGTAHVWAVGSRQETEAEGGRCLDAEELVAAAASFTLISTARFTWARCAHRPRLFLALCSHNARTQLLRKLPGAHLAACAMAGEGGRRQIRGSISRGAYGGARAPRGGIPREETGRAVPTGGCPVPAPSPSRAGGSLG